MELTWTTEKSEKETVKPSWRRRALKIILWLVGVPIALAVLLTIYFCIGGIEWGDWTIPDEADLRLEVREVPDEENAYLALQALTNVYHVAEGDDESAEISDETFVMYYSDPSFRGHVGDDLGKWSAIRSDPASPERAARILADNAEFFEGFKPKFHGVAALRAATPRNVFRGLRVLTAWNRVPLSGNAAISIRACPPRVG